MGHQDIRIPPQNVEAEKSVLGSMLIDDEAIGLALEILDEAFFYEENHQLIYKAMLDLYNGRKKIDLITLTDKLKNDGLLENIGGASYLSFLIDFVPTSANVEHYAQIVKEKGVLRRLIKNASKIVSESFEAKDNVEGIVDNAERLIFEIADLKHRQQAFHIKDLVRESIETIDGCLKFSETSEQCLTPLDSIESVACSIEPVQ